MATTMLGGLSLDGAGWPLADGQPLRLPPKERAVLGLLLRRHPAVVSKAEFATAVWADQEMSDESLARCVSRLRRALLPLGVQVEALYGLGYHLLEAGAPARGPSAQAQDAYVHARQLLLQRTPSAVGLAIDLLRRLVRDEPNFLAARVALGEALVVAIGWGQVPTSPAVEEGLSVLDGLQTKGHIPGLHAARGALLDMAWRFDAAGRAFEQAMQLDGQSPDTLLAYSRHLLCTDDAARAVDVLRQVRTLAPHALHARMNLTRALIQAGRGHDAVVEVQAALVDHPGQLVLVAFSLAIQAMAEPRAELEAAAWRLTQGADVPPFAWTVLSFVLAQLGRREDALDIIDTVLLCSALSAGEASLYAAPLAAMGEHDRAAQLLGRACDERCGMLALVLRDPAHAGWLAQHAHGQALLNAVFGEGQ